MEYIPDFKRNIDNPYNIKAFYLLFNDANVRSGITPDDVKILQTEILREKPKKRKESVQDILRDVKIDYSDIDQEKKNEKLEKVNYQEDYVPLKSKVKDLEFNSPEPSKQDFEFVKSDFKLYDEKEEISIQSELQEILKARYKSQIRILLKEIKLVDDKFEIEPFHALMEKRGVTTEHLQFLINILETELSTYEGRTFVRDGITMVVGVAETWLDGSVNVLGLYPDLTGLQSTMEVSLRKRKMETANIHRSFKENVGVGSFGQILLDLGLNAGITLQRNAKSGTSKAVSDAVRIKRNLTD